MTKQQRERIRQTAETFKFEFEFETEHWVVYKTKYLTNTSLKKLSTLTYVIEPNPYSHEVEISFRK